MGCHTACYAPVAHKIASSFNFAPFSTQSYFPSHVWTKEVSMLRITQQNSSMLIYQSASYHVLDYSNPWSEGEGKFGDKESNNGLLLGIYQCQICTTKLSQNKIMRHKYLQHETSLWNWLIYLLYARNSNKERKMFKDPFIGFDYFRSY